MPNKPQYVFSGFELPEQNWFRMPNAWTDITRDITSLGELKVVEYVLRHTWGFREYGLAKRISTDEFMNGRRHKDGSRMDRGTGLSKPSVIVGLRRAVANGYLIEDKDTTDKARVKKFYSLRMKSRTATAASVNDEPAPDGSAPGGPVKILDPDVKNLDRGGKKVDTSGQESRHRSEKDTSERQSTVTVNGDATKQSRTHGMTGQHSGRTHPVTQLDRLDIPQEHAELLAHDIAANLGDSGSLPFYCLVAHRVPEQVIRRELADISISGADNRAKLFNYRIRRYVETHLAHTRMQTFAQFKRNWPRSAAADPSRPRNATTR